MMLIGSKLTIFESKRYHFNKVMNKTEKTFSFISVKDSFFKARYEVLDESTGDNHVITYENKAPVHPSLSEALQRMAYHVVNFTGLVAVDDNFQITGYQRQNCGDAQLLTIYARVGTSEEFCGNVVSRFHIGRDEYASIDLLLEDLKLFKDLTSIKDGEPLKFAGFGCYAFSRMPTYRMMDGVLKRSHSERQRPRETGSPRSRSTQRR